jgi:tetratricopeptide (TPR) repeat protein
MAQPTESGAARLLETEASARLLEEGRTHMWAFRLQPAEAHFRQLAEQPGGAPAAYHHLAMTALLRGVVTDDNAHVRTFFERSDSLRMLLETEPQGVWRQQLQAETTLQRVLAAGKLGRYIRAALAARSAYNQFSALVEAHPEFDDAYLGMGLLHLTVASLPAGWRDLLEWLGFGGTAVQGYAELNRAATQSRYNQQPAKLLLALADIVLNQEVEAGTERLGQLYDAHSESMLYAHLYGFALYSNRQAERAESVLRGAIERNDPDYFFIDYLDYYLGESLFVQNQFEEAIPCFRRYLSRHQGAALRAMTRYRLGVALEMTGQRAAALELYQQVETERDFDSDRYAQRWAQKRIEAPLDSLGRALLRAENLFFSGDYDRAQAKLKAIHQHSGATAAQKSEAAFYIGRVHHVQKRYDRAYPAYLYVVNHPGDPEAEWQPWAQLYIAEMYEAQGKTEQAIAAYEKALAFEPPYDYAQSLEQIARIALEQLEES